MILSVFQLVMKPSTNLFLLNCFKYDDSLHIRGVNVDPSQFFIVQLAVFNDEVKSSMLFNFVRYLAFLRPFLFKRFWRFFCYQNARLTYKLVILVCLMSFLLFVSTFFLNIIIFFFTLMSNMVLRQWNNTRTTQLNRGDIFAWITKYYNIILIYDSN